MKSTVDDSRDKSDRVEYNVECRRLRKELENVLIDYQTQQEEVVALRKLAKSLKKEVEKLNEQQQRETIPSSTSKRTPRPPQHVKSHTLLTLRVQMAGLQEENAELRRLLEQCHDKLKVARICISQKVPAYKLAAVKAKAELQCVTSQLQQERAHSDLLERQAVRWKARQDQGLARCLRERDDKEEEEQEHLQASENVLQERKAFLRQCLNLQRRRTSLGSDRRRSDEECSEISVSDSMSKVRDESTEGVSPSPTSSLILDSTLRS